MGSVSLVKVKSIVGDFPGVKQAFYFLRGIEDQAKGATISSIDVERADVELLTKKATVFCEGDIKSWQGHVKAHRAFILVVWPNGSSPLGESVDELELKAGQTLATALRDRFPGKDTRSDSRLGAADTYLICFDWQIEWQDFFLLENEIAVTIIRPPKTSTIAELVASLER